MSTRRTRRRLAPCNGGANQCVRQSGSTPRILGAYLDASGGGTANGVAFGLCDRVGRAGRRCAHG